MGAQWAQVLEEGGYTGTVAKIPRHIRWMWWALSGGNLLGNGYAQNEDKAKAAAEDAIARHKAREA